MWIKSVRQQKISEKIQNCKEQIKNIKQNKTISEIKNSLHSTNNRLHTKKKWSVNIKISQQKLSKPKYSERLTEKI